MPHRSHCHGLAFALPPFFYFVTSLLMTFLNKSLLSYYNFPHASIIIFVQCIGTVVVLYLCKLANFVTLEEFAPETITKLIDISVLYSLNSCVALYSLANLNVAMYSILKRGFILLVLIGEAYYLGVIPSLGVILSVISMIVGTVLAGLGDLDFSLYGYSMSFLSCFLQAAWILILKKKQIKEQVSIAGLMYYNSFLSIPIIGIYLIATDEIKAIQAEMENNYGTEFLVVFILVIFCGILLNFAQFLCATYSGPLTFAVTGQGKSLFVTLIGTFVFGFREFNLFVIFGLFINMLGTGAYAILKIIAQWEKE